MPGIGKLIIQMATYKYKRNFFNHLKYKNYIKSFTKYD